MSRSYRKPYTTWYGHCSAKDDKRLAHRGERFAVRQALHLCQDWDEFLTPHKFECSWNDVWSWGRDGKQFLTVLDHNDFNPYHHVFKSSRPRTYEQLVQGTLDDIERLTAYIAKLSRK